MSNPEKVEMGSETRYAPATAAAEVQHVDQIDEVGEDDSPPIQWRTWLAIVALCFMFNCGLSMYILTSSIQGYINEAIGPDPDFAWISSGKTVATAAVGVLAGTISDLFGRRIIIIGGSILGLIGCIVGATAQSVGQVVGAMVIMGAVSGAGYNSMACACELVSKKQRGMVLGIVSFSSLPFTCFGTLISNGMVESAVGWRGVFYLGIALCSVSTVMNYFFYQPAVALAAHGRTRRQILSDFDYIGFFAVCAGPSLFLIGIIWAGGRYKFSSPQVLGTFISGIVICIALGFYEVYFAKHPILHPQLFKRVRTYTLLLVCIFTGGTVFYSMTAIFPLYLRLVFVGNDPMQIGIYGLPMGITTAVGGLVVGVVAPIVGHTRLILTAGVCVQVLSIGLLAYPNPSQIALPLVLTGIGGLTIGWIQILCNLLVQLAMPDELIGFATGIGASIRLLGGSVGIAVYSTIYRTQATEIVPGRVGAAALATGLPQTAVSDFITTFLTQPGELANVSGVTPEIIAAAANTAKQAYCDAFKPVWYTAVGIGSTAILAAIFTKDMSNEFTNEVTQTLLTKKDSPDVESKVV